MSATRLYAKHGKRYIPVAVDAQGRLVVAGGGAGGGDASAANQATQINQVAAIVAQRVPAAITATDDGAVAAGAHSVSFITTGESPATVLGVALPPLVPLTFDAGSATLGAIAYDATDTTLLIAQIRPGA